MKGSPKNPKERGAWPEQPGTKNFDDPVEVTIMLERPVYEWLAKYLTTDEGCTSFTASVEETFSTFIRALAKDGLDLDFVKNHLAPQDFTEKIDWSV